MKTAQDMEGQPRRNGEMELLRFLAALLVVATHAHYFSGCLTLCPGGNIAVEFFFVLSGYLMAASASKSLTAGAGGFAAAAGRMGYFVVSPVFMRGLNKSR